MTDAGAGFAIEFSVEPDIADVAEGLAVTRERFRVLVASERIMAYVFFVDSFGDAAWARIVGSEAWGASPMTWTAPLSEERILALAFRGYLVAEHRNITPSASGVPVIDIGTVTREA